MKLRNPRIQVGDLVEHRAPPPLRAGKAFLVIATNLSWLKFLGEGNGWVQATDYEVISDSR